MQSKTLNILSSEQLDWVSFNGFREKLYLKKRKPYSQEVGDESWGQVLSCSYFASAYLKPGASTGLHHHDQVCIVTVVTSGTLSHDDSEGHRIDIREGQHLVQYAGVSGFKHSESNCTNAFTGIVQIWLDPALWKTCNNTKVELVELGAQSSLLGQSANPVNSDVVLSNHYHITESVQLESLSAIVFCYKGSIQLTREGQDSDALREGQMALVNHKSVISPNRDAGFIVIARRV